MAALVEAPRGPRAGQLAVLFAAWTGHLDVAKALHGRLQTLKSPRRLLAKVEATLEQRAISLSGDPVYGLVLHNEAVYVDAQLWAHLVADYWTRGHLVPSAARRRLAVAARQKALLVEVLTALSCVERPPSFPARRAILRQIEDLQLPAFLTAQLRNRIKDAFARRPTLAMLVAPVRTAPLRRFILEQTVLASLVDGRRSRAEVDFLSALAAALHVSQEALRTIEAEVAEFYAHNRSVVDVFTVGSKAGALADEWVASMQHTLDRNVHGLLIEAREMGELSVFLGRLARGHALTVDERRRMRLQLLEVAKAIPALAIFAAPGGVLLLAALAKVLPPALLPRAFQDGDADREFRPRER